MCLITAPSDSAAVCSKHTPTTLHTPPPSPYRLSSTCEDPIPSLHNFTTPSTGLLAKLKLEDPTPPSLSGSVNSTVSFTTDQVRIKLVSAPGCSKPVPPSCMVYFGLLWFTDWQTTVCVPAELCVRQDGQQHWGPTRDCSLLLPLNPLHHGL